MSSLKMLTIDLRIKTRLTKLIHTVLYKNTPTYLTDLLHLKKCIRPLRNSNSTYATYHQQKTTWRKGFSV